MVADGFAVLTTRLAVAGDAEFLALAAPAEHFDLLLFTHQPADLLAGCGTPAVGARAVFGVSSTRGHDGERKEKQQHSVR
jgi:hypothetical protein